ncbi:MAG: prefoldin subunit alpha [Thermoplasmata archaeon]|nr:prefoldin subunit alpha [Thermoplasmata archaeon]
MADEEPEMDENMKFQQSLVYLESLKSQLEALGQQQEILRMAELEHSQARETLTKYQDLKDGDELLVPVGADSMVFASVADQSKVIINIGAKYAVEQSIEDSVITLGKRIDRIRENRDKTDKSMEGLQQQAEMLTLELQGMYRKLQQPGQD